MHNVFKNVKITFLINLPKILIDLKLDIISLTDKI